MFNKTLVSFLDKWKAENPKIFALIAALLIMVKASIVLLQDSGMISADMSNIIGWLTFIIALMVSQSTTNKRGELPHSTPQTETPTLGSTETVAKTLKKRGRPHKEQ